MIANEFNQLLEFILTREAKISDINFSPGRAPQAEINGQLAEIPIKGMTKLTTYQTELIAMHMMKNDREQIRKLLKNGSIKTYPGYPHGMATIHADVLNPDILAFIRS